MATEDDFFVLPADVTKQEIREAWDRADRLMNQAELSYDGIQGRHSVYVMLGSMFLAEAGQPGLWEWVIDAGAERLGDPNFQRFVQGSEVREGLRRLYYHTVHCVLNRKYLDLADPIQQSLIMALGLRAPAELPVENRPDFTNLASSLVADTAVVSRAVREMNRPR